jgi:hypothetical protein
MHGVLTIPLVRGEMRETRRDARERERLTRPPSFAFHQDDNSV